LTFLFLKRNNRQNGFALLIAIVISTVVLTIGVSIINIALREVILASTVRNSLSGFYIADSGVECALYWDNVRGNFSMQSVFASGGDSSDASVIECNGNKVSISKAPIVEFRLVDLEDINKPCATISFQSNPSGPEKDKVILRSIGSNTCATSNPRRVERALEVKYNRFQ